MASLPEALYALPTERLRALAQTRNVEQKKLASVTDKRQLALLLANELSRPPSITAALQQCSARELRLLQLLLAADGVKPYPLPQLLERAGVSAHPEALQEPLRRLEEWGLVFLMPNGVFLPDAARQLVPASLPDRFPLMRCLQSYDAPTVKRIAANLGLPVPGTKDATIEAIRAHLLDARPVRLNVPLPPEERLALEFLAQAGGAATAMEIASALFDGRMEDFYRYDWPTRWREGKERNAIDRLLAKGLLHVASQGYAYYMYLIIPGDLLRALTGSSETDFWTAPPPVPTPLPDPPAAGICHTGLSRDVVMLLAFLSRQEATRTNTGHIHKTSLKNLARALSRPDETYAAFLYAVCREADLIAPQGGEKPVYMMTPRGNSWLYWDVITQTRALFEAWRKGAVWAEMYQEPLRQANDYRPEEAVRQMRQLALGVIAETVSERFLSYQSVADTLAYRYPLRLMRGPTLGPDMIASPLDFVQKVVGQCLFWLGMAEVVSEEGAGYRLTPLGAYLLGQPEADAPAVEPQEDRFILQANAEVFVSPYLAPAILYRLLTLTDPPTKGAAGNTVTLTREAIRRALDQGETVREILAFLQTHSQTGIPQNVEYLINEVGGRHGHIHIGRAQLYVQVDSPLLLQELEARREFKPYFVRALSDTVAILRGDDPEKLVKELRKAGYLPVLDDAPKLSFRSASRHTPPKPYTPAASEERAARRAAKLDAVVDWERIARDDDQPWHPPRTSTASETGDAPDAAVVNPVEIRRLLLRAAQRRQKVEIAYQGSPEIPPEVKLLAPRSSSGSLIVADLPEEGRRGTFNFAYIRWARPVD